MMILKNIIFFKIDSQLFFFYIYKIFLKINIVITKELFIRV